MNTARFIGLSTWIGILTIIFGVLLGAFDSNFTTWFFFVFLCAVGVLTAGYTWKDK